MFKLVFWIRNAGGKLVLSKIYRASSLLEIYSILSEFAHLRAKVPASSRTLFGGEYTQGSLEWIAAHSVFWEIYSEDDLAIESGEEMQPYLERIIKAVD